jgi:hypothetical protein
MTTRLITVKPSYVLIENLFMRRSAQSRFIESQNRFKVIPWEVVNHVQLIKELSAAMAGVSSNHQGIKNQVILLLPILGRTKWQAWLMSPAPAVGALNSSTDLLTP